MTRAASTLSPERAEKTKTSKKSDGKKIGLIGVGVTKKKAGHSKAIGVSHQHANHPTYADMILAAAKSLHVPHKRRGATRQALAKYVRSHYDVSEKTFNSHFRQGLKQLLESENLVVSKGKGLRGLFRYVEKKPHRSSSEKSSSSSSPSKPKATRKSMQSKRLSEETATSSNETPTSIGLVNKSTAMSGGTEKANKQTTKSSTPTTKKQS